MVQPQVRFPIFYTLHIADLCVMTCVGLHVLSAMQEGRSLLRFGIATKLGLALVVVSLASLYMGPLQTSHEWNAYIDIVVKNVLIMVLMEAMCWNVQRVWAVLMTIMIASVWWEKAGVRLSAMGATYGSGSRIMGAGAGLVENPNSFAYMMCVLIPLYAYFNITAKDKWTKRIFLAALLMAAYIVIQTGSRAGFLALVVGGGVVALHYGRKQFMTLFMAGIGVVILLNFVDAGNIERIKTIQNSINEFFSGETKARDEMDQDELSADDRKNKNRDTWRLIKAYPLFGVGINANQSLYAERFPFATGQTHCEILLAGRQMGFIGMGLYVGFISIILFGGLKLRKRMIKAHWGEVAEQGWMFFCVGIMFIVGGAFAPSVWNAMMMFFCGACSSLLLNFKKSDGTIG